MSQATVEQIIGRLALDREFRQQMAADRDAALTAYDLSEDEKASLAGLDLAELDGAASMLGERVSKGLQSN